MMKNYPIFQRLIIFLFSILFIISCGKLDALKNPLDGFKIYINYDIFDTFMSLRFIDTATGELINSTDVVVTILGTHKEAVVDQLGNNNETFTSVYGLMSLALNPKDSFVPTDDNPIQFSLLTIADGYIENEVEITLDSTGLFAFNIYLENASAVTKGIKKYVRDIPLRNSALIDSFSLCSTGGEFSLTMPKNLELLDANRNAVTDTIAVAELIVYTNLNRVPVPGQLVTNFEIDGNVELKAFNPISIISFSIKTAAGEIKYINDGEIEFTFGLTQKFINPLTGIALASGNMLPVCNYNKMWKQEAEQPIIENDDSLFVKYGTNHLSLFGLGIVQPVCDFSGKILFNLSNKFPVEPISTRVYCYRERDNKYIGYSDYDLSQQNLFGDFNFSVPVDEAAVLRVRQKSNANAFSAMPANISVQTPCVQNYQYNVDLASTSISFQGEVSFHFTEPFPKENFNVRVGFYRADNNSLLLSKVYNVSQDKTVLIETGVPVNQKLYLKFSAANQDDAFTHFPEEIFIDDPSTPNQSWQVSLTPTNCASSGALNINYEGVFENDPIELILRFIDNQTKSIYKEKILTLTPPTNNISFSEIFPKEQMFQMQILRTGSGQTFHAYPYLFPLDQTCTNSLYLHVTLSPVVEQFVVSNVTVECPSAEILPTLQGFYRLVWEDDWHGAEIVNGFIGLNLELNGTYEVGIIIDNKMKIQEYKVTNAVNNIIFELDDEECDKMGW